MMDRDLEEIGELMRDRIDVGQDEAVDLYTEVVRLRSQVATQSNTIMEYQAECIARSANVARSDKALTIVTILANTDPTEWLSKQEIHAGLAEFATLPAQSSDTRTQEEVK